MKFTDILNIIFGITSAYNYSETYNFMILKKASRPIFHDLLYE